MDNQTTPGNNEIAVGDQVVLTEKSFSDSPRMITAKIIDIRWILGKLSYVIETEEGKRKVVGPTQILRLAE